MHTEVAKLIDLARQQGWRVETEGKHAKFYFPPGVQLDDGSTIYTVSLTPTSENSITQSKFALQKAGLITSSSELKRHRRQKRKGGSDLPRMDWNERRSLIALQAFVNADPEAILNLAMTTQEGKDAADMGDKETLAYIMTVMQSWPEWYRDCICGASFASPVALVKHMMKAEGGLDSEDKTNSMSAPGHSPKIDPEAPLPCEREPSFIPDPSTAVRCPFDDCKAWVFTTQAYLLETHIVHKHPGYGFCTYGCGRVLFDWAQGVHHDCCFKNPDHAHGRQVWEERHTINQVVIDRFAEEGKPAKWPRITVRGLNEDYLCVVKGPERGTPYNAMPCLGACGAPVGSGRPHSSLCEACDTAVDRATEARRAAMESARPTVPDPSEKAAETPEKIAEQVDGLTRRVSELEEALERALERISDLERRGAGLDD